ncbi:hypothetical protein ACLGIH_19920 [Streptomyces sp. HMX87]|uniref:hypothetical protein n=1 Tax=Streptomyces sp. HMX87 TaxID=3390849 RepID=UPI003A864DA8
MDFNSNQFRQSAFRGFGDQAMRRHRVTPATPQNGTPAQPAAPSGWTQPELPDPPAAPPPRVDPSSVPDNTPPPPPATPSGPGQQVRINQLAYRAQGQRFGPPPEPDTTPAPSAVPPRPTTPPRPTAPPSSVSGRSGFSITPGMARAGRAVGVGTFVAAKALQSINRPATDPKRSGNPLYKTNQGWMRS